MKITKKQIKAAEEVASDVFDERSSITRGAKSLAEDHGINLNSAKNFINNYSHMIQGTVYRRAMSAAATDYFLLKIRKRRGRRAYSRAVIAANLHLNYYEHRRNEKLYLLRKVLSKHAAVSNPLEHAQLTERFSRGVQESLRDSSRARAARLEKAPKLPTIVPVVSYAYVRNPDVVAEVLVRAEGKCERCKTDAPFVRKKDLQPYLEVHHIIQLADGGEDTTSNALALCPNCHRHLHYGVLPDPEAVT